jgi:hypothetical protein
MGRHVGYEHGGTMMFMCDRCGRSCWQPLKYRARLATVERQADSLIDAGRLDEARTLVRQEVARVAGRDGR